MAGDSHVVLAEYNGDDLKATAILFLVLTGLSVGLRTYVRGFMTTSFQVDDWLMLVAQANFILSCAFILIAVNLYGLGHHNQALPQWQEIGALKWQALATATYITNMMFIKLSIGVFLLRLAVQTRYKVVIYISMAVVAIWSTALFFWDVFQCHPVAAQWDYTTPEYTCVTAEQVVNAAYALSVLNIITDWLYALLPVPMIWKVKMTSQAKVTVVAILGLGIFASVATLIRVKFLAQLEDTSDILFAGTDAMVWTLVEPGVAIVASSLVTIRPLLRRMRLKGFESTERSRSRGLWGGRSRGGRSTSGGGGLSGNNYHSNGGGILGMNSNKMGQWSQVPSEYNSESLKLKDLEAGISNVSAGDRGGKRGVVGKGSNGVPCSVETTLSSRTSTQTNRLGNKWVGGGEAGGMVGLTLRDDHQHPPRDHETETSNFRARGGGGVGIAVTTTNDGEEIISPISVSPLSTTTTTKFYPEEGQHHQPIQQQHSAAAPTPDSSSESVLIIEGVQQRRAAVGGGGGGHAPPTWKDERPPRSLEEAEESQGLRLPVSAARRAAVGDDGTCIVASRMSSTFSLQGLPIQSNR